MKDIWKKNKITLLVLIILIIAGTIILGISGFEKSPDLKAGTKIEIYIPKGYDKQEVIDIAKECFNNIRTKTIYCLSLLISVVIINLVWLKISSSYLSAFETLRNSNSSKQLTYVLTNPLSYLMILFNTIDNNIYGYLDQIASHALGPLTIGTSYIFVVIVLGILLNLTIEKDSKAKLLLNNIEILYTIAITLSTILLIFTSLYIQWTSIYNKLIDGVQGRYFIPLLPLICFPFITNTKKKETINSFCLITIVLFNIISIITIFTTYI